MKITKTEEFQITLSREELDILAYLMRSLASKVTLSDESLNIINDLCNLADGILNEK